VQERLDGSIVVVADGETLAAGQIHWPLTLTCSLSCDSLCSRWRHSSAVQLSA
jgi:hypothetical protein